MFFFVKQTLRSYNFFLTSVAKLLSLKNLNKTHTSFKVIQKKLFILTSKRSNKFIVMEY